MIIKFFFLGLFIKLIAGLDDTITHIPVLASVTKKHMGRVAFSIGILIAVTAAILISIFFSSLITHISYYRYIFAGLIFALAIGIYFDVFIHKPREKAEEKLKKKKAITAGKFAQLLSIGFVASFATVMDDIIVFLPLFAVDSYQKIFAVAGILVATILEILVVIYFSNLVSKIKYKEKIAGIGLFILGILILIGII